MNRLSPHAGDGFANITSRQAVNYSGVISEAQDVYGALIYRIEILRGIAKEPNVYF
jgi:hypothetical protein